MRPQEAYRRVSDGLKTAKQIVLGTLDNYVEQGAVAIQKHVPTSVPVHVETRVPSPRYAEKTPTFVPYTPTVRSYRGGDGSPVTKLGAARCNVNMNAQSNPRARRRERRRKRRIQKKHL